MTQMTSSPDRIRQALDAAVDPYSTACGCMGPKGDEPLCPCAMQNVIRWRGRWIQLNVLGGETPAKDYLNDLVPEQPTSPSNAGVGKMEWDVILTGYEGKLPVLMVVREIAGLGLAQAKHLVDNVPKALAEGRSKEEAMMIKMRIEAVGGTVELR